MRQADPCLQGLSCTMMLKSRKSFDTPGEAHFLTFSCFNNRPFLTSDLARGWLCASIGRACALHDYALWGYVIMPEHVHLIVNPRNDRYQISEFLRSAKQSVTRKAIAYRGASRKPESAWERFYDIQPNGEVHFRFWQRGGGHDRNINSPDEALEKLEYIHNNPVRRGLCDTPACWPWSSAGFYAGLGDGSIPVTPIRY